MRNTRDKILGILNLLLSLLGIAFIGMLIIMLARDIPAMFEALNVTNRSIPYGLIVIIFVLMLFTLSQLILGIFLLFTSKQNNSKYTKLGIALIILWGIIIMIFLVYHFMPIISIYEYKTHFKNPIIL